MKQIAMRDFQLGAPKYLKDLPIALTRYGEVVAFVTAPNTATDITFEDVEPKTKTEVRGKDLTKLRQTMKETEKKFAIKPIGIPEPRNDEMVEATVQVKKGTFKYNGLTHLCSHGYISGKCPEGCVK
jgi:hypothetical protein